MTGAVPAQYSGCESCEQARSLQRRGKCDEALSLLKKEIKKNKTSVEALGLQVICYANVDKHKQAAKSLDAFLELAPTSDQLSRVRASVAFEASPTPKVNIRFGLPDRARPPILLLFNRPIPSEDSQDFQAFGGVIIHGVLGKDGKLTRLEEDRSGDYSRQTMFGYGDSAMRSMRGWRFFPALQDGYPIAVGFSAAVWFGPGAPEGFD